MSAILDDVDMTVVLPMLLRLFCFLRLLRLFWKEKRLLLFFWKEKRLLLCFCKGLKIEWLNLTGIDKILDAGKQNLTELDPMVVLCSSYSLLLNIIDGVFDAKELRFIDLPLDIEIKMVLREIKMVLLVTATASRLSYNVMAMFLGLSNKVIKFQSLKSRDQDLLELRHMVLMVFREVICIKEVIDERFWGLGLRPWPSISQNKWLNFRGMKLICLISMLLMEFNWINLTEDTSFTNAQRDNGQVAEDTSFTNAQRENGQVEEEDTSFINAQRVFKIETLVTATDNFDDNNKLGEGGFGTVYKGTTDDGKQIAVKLLSTSDRGRKEFLNEKLLAKIQHRNIVNLLGCCKEGSQMFVVYEYLPNGSLHKFLSDVEKRKGLDWQKRYNIILRIAHALQYLHEESQLRIVHRDIKASNILLDEKLNPKIADFGTAKVLPKDETHVSTVVVGTPGYFAPEYFRDGQLSVNVDVYNFGILLLELVTGKKKTSEMDFLGKIFSSYKHGKSAGTIDQAIIATCDKKQALRCIHIGLLCTQDKALLRPPMSEVTVMLSTPSVALPVPTEPPLYDEIHKRGCCFFR